MQNIVTLPKETHRVVFLILPDVQLLDLAGPAQVFHQARSLGADYELLFCSSDPTATSAQGLTFANLLPLIEVRPSDLVIVPGISSEGHTPNDILIDASLHTWLTHAHNRAAHIASVCTGAFILGEAGLLDGLRCTTHWGLVTYLQARHPKAIVRDNVLYVSDQNITTSAGVASGIDMALALIERQHGPIFTALVARQLVIYLRRNGTQTQNSVYLEYRTHLHPGVHRAQDYIISHIAERLTLEQIAAAAQLSPRSLSRTFKEATNLTPVQYHQRLRLELAATLLHNPQLSLEDIATKCGFDDGRHFRRLWQIHFGVSPSATRKRLTHNVTQLTQ